MPPTSRLARITSIECDDLDKDIWHREAKRVLRLVVKELGLLKGSYDIRSNKGGHAVSGEVTLHTDTFYLQVMGSFNNPNKLQILLRTCKSMKDYTGGMNTYPGIETLEDIPEFCARLRRHYMNPADKLFATTGG